VIRSTTILCVQRGGAIAMAGDGQVTQNETILKAGARKVRRLLDGRVVAGFAGATADALTLFELFEAKLKDKSGGLTRAAVELAKDWRTDRRLRNLNALMIVTDGKQMLLLTGAGDVVEPDGGVLAVGSGSSVALGAARALLAHTELDAETIAREAMGIAAELDVYTNDRLQVEVLRDA
jgi:ATP-dependent HslUV protease, peptidase subunit HslV